MKIRLNLPTLSEVFSHDAPLYKIIKTALPAFILISSLTVFLGVRSHLSEYLIQYPWYITLPGYSFSYVLFSLAPDVLNAILVAYFARSILKKKFKTTDIIINLCALVLIVFLTNYSYNMSQFSAGSVSNEIGKDLEVIDLSKINTEYNLEKKEIQTVYKDDKSNAETVYNEKILNLNSTYENLIIPLRKSIEQFNKNRSNKNTQWTTREINKVNKSIADLQNKQLTTASDYLKEKEGKINGFALIRNGDLKSLSKDKATDRENGQSLKEKNNDERDQANTFLRSEFEKIAGFAIFIVLVLASLKEIIHFRNDIDPLPILGELDFQFDWIHEAIYLPLIFIQRHLINKVRKAYNNLPDLVEAPQDPQEIEEVNGSQKIVPLKIVDYESADQPDRSFFRNPQQEKISASTALPFIADEKQTKTSTNGKRETIEMRTTKRRLKQYKKDLGKHIQKARIQKNKDGFITARTQKAIDNNSAWIEHYQDILNGGPGTRK